MLTNSNLALIRVAGALFWAASFSIFLNSQEEVASIEVYNYPDVIVPPTSVLDNQTPFTAETKRSERYAVEVEQNGQAKSAYVMFTPNPHVTGNLGLSPDTHWTSFSMSGKVTVTVTNLSGPITSCQIYPSRKGYTANIQGDTASFTIDSASGQIPLQLYLRINEINQHPLLVFADPPETDVPDRNDTDNVEIIQTSDDIETVRSKLSSAKLYAVFEEGIHSWGELKDSSYSGYQLPYVSNKRIYVPGGAYVIGTFQGSEASNTKVYGRGVLSACGKDRIATSVGIPYSFVEQTGSGSNQIIEGLVTTDPPHFHLTYRGEVVIDNVKMIGYWHQTDGTVTGDNSVVKNPFMKTNDDYIKVYSNNCYHYNNTMFHQVNGAPFQFCWGGQNGDNNLMEDTYIIYSSYNPGANNKRNTAVICARNGPEAITENNTWDGIYIDNGCHKLLGLNAQNEPASIWRNFTIKNVEINTGFADSPQDGPSYLLDGTANNFVNIRFENLFINGDPITGANAGSDIDGDGKIWFETGGEYPTFETNYPDPSVSQLEMLLEETLAMPKIRVVVNETNPDFNYTCMLSDNIKNWQRISLGYDRSTSSWLTGDSSLSISSANELSDGGWQLTFHDANAASPYFFQIAIE